MTELLDCPFCGGNGFSMQNHARTVWQTSCTECHAGTPSRYQTKEMAETAWNTRQAASHGSAGGERAEVQTEGVTPTKEDFAKWSRVWHDTCETMVTLLGLPGGDSPQELLTQVQALATRPAPSIDQIANIVSDYYDEDDAGRWRKCAQHIADSFRGAAQEAGNSGETAQPVAGPMRLDLMLEKVEAENAQNGEAFNDMRAHVWAAGASHEDADFITRMLTRKGLYLFQAEPWKRCPSTHCDRRGECASSRDCTVARPAPSAPSAECK